MLKKLSWLFLICLLSLALIAGCSNQEDSNLEGDEEPNQEGTDEQAQEEEEIQFVLTQSPFLEGKDLPALEDRLPLEPKITNEMDPSQLEYEIGQFGGMLRMTSAVPDWNADLFVMMNEPLINTPGLLGEEITGNVLKSVEVSDDQQEFTFTMREGLRWSDGEPVTMEDVLFTYEDVLLNEELTPGFPAKYRSGGKPDGTPMQLEEVDEYTFKITFDEPYGGFLMRIAIQGWASYTDLIKPKHVLEQYHIDYADETELMAQVTEAGFEEGEWFNLFHEKDIINTEVTNVLALGFPTLNPWILVNTNAEKYEYERNPYYFKVDEAGNQLPYIDQVESVLTQDTEMVNMKILAGEIDFTRESTSLNNIPLYKENEERAGYTTIVLKTHGRPGSIFINQTYDDPAWQEIAQDVRFRQALNYGIDRTELIDAIYYGFAEEPSLFNEGTYNPDLANQLLDEVGLDQKDSDGFRLGPDGERFEIYIEISSRVPETIPQSELLVQYWRDLGLSASMRTVDPTLWGTRTSANEVQVTVERMEDYWWQGDMKANLWAPQWFAWYNSNGDQGIEPPDEVKQVFTLMSETTGKAPEEGFSAFEAIQALNREHLFIINAVENAEQPLIVSAQLGNVPHDGTTIAANFAGEQLFFRD